jgi:hypothetical protein
MFTVTINVPGYQPMADDDPPVFDTAADAWDYASNERALEEDGAGTCHDDNCTDPACPWNPDADYTDDVTTMAKRTEPGTVVLPTAGYHGDHDLGIAYSVEPADADTIARQMTWEDQYATHPRV